MAFLKMDTYCYKNYDKNEMIQVYILIFFLCFVPGIGWFLVKTYGIYLEKLFFPISETPMAHFNWE